MTASLWVLVMHRHEGLPGGAVHIYGPFDNESKPLDMADKFLNDKDDVYQGFETFKLSGSKKRAVCWTDQGTGR